MNFRDLFLYTLPAVLLSLTVHEFSHGLASTLLGDPTPRVEGRLSLNPLRHLDPVGTLCLALFQFGWARPVMVDTRYYKNQKQGMVLTALAGPLSNLLLSFLAILGLVTIQVIVGGGLVRPADWTMYLFYLFHYISLISLGLGIFNLFPIPPLDGSKILLAILPEEIYFRYMRYERFGTFLLLGLLYAGLLDGPLYGIRTFLYDGMFGVARTLFGL